MTTSRPEVLGAQMALSATPEQMAATIHALQSLETRLEGIHENGRLVLEHQQALAKDMAEVKTQVAVLQERDKRVEKLESKIGSMEADLASLKTAEAVRKGERGAALGILNHPFVGWILMGLALLGLAMLAKIGIVGVGK